MRENKKLYFWQAYSHTMLASFILFVIYNSIYENIILEFTGIKVIYQVRILKVILQVRKLWKIEDVTSSKFVPILSKETFSEYLNKNQLIYL